MEMDEKKFLLTLWHDVEDAMRDYGLHKKAETGDINTFLRDFTIGRISPSSSENSAWTDGKYRGWTYKDATTKDMDLAPFDIVMKFSKEGEDDIFVVFNVVATRYNNPLRYCIEFMTRPPYIAVLKEITTTKISMKY